MRKNSIKTRITTDLRLIILDNVKLRFPQNGSSFIKPFPVNGPVYSITLKCFDIFVKFISSD